MTNIKSLPFYCMLEKNQLTENYIESEVKLIGTGKVIL